MTNEYDAPEVHFRVGEVRVTIWSNPIRTVNDRDGGRRITIDRRQPPGNNEYTNVLQSEDIPKIMLALRKAHDYIQRTNTAETINAEFQSGTAFARRLTP